MKYKYKIIKKGEEERKERKIKTKHKTHTHNIQTHTQQQKVNETKILIHIATIINARKVKLMLVVTFHKFKVIGQS